MFLKKSYGFWSTLFSLLGIVLLTALYILVPDVPKGIISILIQITQVLIILSLLSGIVLSIISIKKKETGIKKYIGILIPLSILLFIILVPIIMALYL